MATTPCNTKAFAILLWRNLVSYGQLIVVHTGEVQGSIPCASTIVVLITKLPIAVVVIAEVEMRLGASF
jgi:hypothetical protein